MNEIAEKYIFDQSSIIFIISAVLNFAIFIFLVGSNNFQKEKNRQYLAISIISVAIWMGSSWLNHFIQDSNIVTFTARLSFSVCVIAAFNLLFFALSWQKKNVKRYMWFLLIAFFIFTFFTPFVIQQEIPSTLDRIEQPIWGGGFAIWSVFMGLLIVVMIYEFIKAYLTTTGSRKEKIKMIMILFVLIVVLMGIFNLLLPNLGIVDFLFVGQLSTLIFAFGSAWIILQEQIYSTNYLAANILALLTSGTILFGLSWGTQKVEQIVFNWNITQIVDIKIIAFGILIGTTVALFVGQIVPSIKRSFYWLFKVSNLNLEELRESLIDLTNKYIDLETFIKGFLKQLGDTLNSNGIIFYIPKYSIWWSSENENSINTKMLDQYTDKKNIWFNEDENHDGFGLVAPLKTEEKLIALLFVKHKRNIGYYSLEEVNGLNRILKILTIATYKYILYKKQQDFVATLQDEIDKATKELKEKYQELDDSYRKERDMMDILGHELRTPLGTARNAVKVMEGLLKENKLDKEKAEKYIDMAVENLQREVRLVETILSGTKIDNGRLQLLFEKVDAVDVVNDSLTSFSNKAEAKGLKLFSTLPEKSEIYVDRTRIQEVIDNLVDNAIKYTENGQIEVKLENFGDLTKFTVADTGSGISDVDLKKLGQKFYRVNTYLGNNQNTEMQIVRPGGTGLGLYVTFNLVKLMHGEIKVESELGKGTRFIVIVPTYIDQPTFNNNPKDMMTKFEEKKLQMQQNGEIK